MEAKRVSCTLLYARKHELKLIHSNMYFVNLLKNVSFTFEFSHQHLTPRRSKEISLLAQPQRWMNWVRWWLRCEWSILQATEGVSHPNALRDTTPRGCPEAQMWPSEWLWVLLSVFKPTQPLGTSPCSWQLTATSWQSRTTRETREWQLYFTATGALSSCQLNLLWIVLS